MARTIMIKVIKSSKDTFWYTPLVNHFLEVHPDTYTQDYALADTEKNRVIVARLMEQHDIPSPTWFTLDKADCISASDSITNHHFTTLLKKE